MYRVAYFVSHPIQYQVPLLRLISADPEICLHVFYYSDFSLRAYHDRDFKHVLQWDVPLEGGYEYTVLPRYGLRSGKSGDNPFLPAKGINQLFKPLRQGDDRAFDAVWVHGWGHACSWQVILAANRHQVPVLIRGDSNAVGEAATGWRRRVKHHVLRWLFRRISAFLSAGSLNKQFYLKYGAPPERIFHLPYAVDNDTFQQRSRTADADQTASLRRELGFDSSRPVILFAAKLTEVKDPFTLLNAYQLLTQGKHPPARKPYLVFVGEGMLRSALEQQASVIDRESIRFVGFKNQSEMPRFYSLCDVLVLPSRFEPWGLVVNEAMNAARAVVVSETVGCAPDLVADGVNGKTFPAGDVPALAAAISWALDHAQNAGEAGLRCIKKWSYQEDVLGLKQALEAVVPT